MAKPAARQIHVPGRDAPRRSGVQAGSRSAEGTRQVVARNRRARHDYAISDTYEAGMVLTGTEVKSMRAGRTSLVDAFVSVEHGEAWLEHMHVPEYVQGTWTNHETRRKRKLLLHAAEIAKLAGSSSDKGYTIVPLQVYFSGGRAKVEIGVAKGKREYDKRHALRERQDDREAQRAMSLRQHR